MAGMQAYHSEVALLDGEIAIRMHWHPKRCALIAAVDGETRVMRVTLAM